MEFVLTKGEGQQTFGFLNSVGRGLLGRQGRWPWGVVRLMVCPSMSPGCSGRSDAVVRCPHSLTLRKPAMVTNLWALLSEKQEAERKRIEAQGISDFQKTVSEVHCRKFHVVFFPQPGVCEICCVWDRAVHIALRFPVFTCNIVFIRGSVPSCWSGRELRRLNA